jgi:flagellar basal body-associated protein FliL
MSTNADATPASGAAGGDAVAPSAAQATADAGAVSSRDSLWLWLSVVVMVVGVVVSIIGFVISHGTTNSLTQNDALTIAIIGISVTVVGGAFFVRFSFSSFLRFWLARFEFDLRDNTPKR